MAIVATEQGKVRSSRNEYARRLNGVLDHIDAHLGDTLEVPQLASVANFSPFHFHRLFSVWMGETVGDYLRRRRLDVGANMLVHRPLQSILDIAVEVGFGSAEAFSRAFRQQFKVSPSHWRTNAPSRVGQNQRKLLDLINSNPDQVTAKLFGNNSDNSELELVSNVAVVILPSVRVAYFRKIGPYGPQIGHFWQDTVFPWRATCGLAEAPCFGIGRDDPEITAPNNCRYDACVQIPGDFAPPHPASVAMLPGGKYAIATFDGHARQVAAAWQELLRSWLPNSGMQVDSRPFFERYDLPPAATQFGSTFQCKLCLPVIPL
jgi:AraC family transcriptional regulator